MQIPVNTLRSGTIFEEQGQPFKVLKYEHVKMGRGNANIKVKVKNLKTGATLEKTFMSGAKVEASEVEHKKVQFLYSTKAKATPGIDGAWMKRQQQCTDRCTKRSKSHGRQPVEVYSDSENYYFMDTSTFEQFALGKDILGEDIKYLKEGLELQLVFFKEEPITLELPTFIGYKVKTAGSSERGNSVSNIYKPVILENNLQVQAPLFIKDEDLIKVDTRDGSYIERLSK